MKQYPKVFSKEGQEELGKLVVKKHYYFSNCLIEAIKQYVKYPNYIKIKRKGRWKLIKKKTFPHFYWYDSRYNEYFHFCARYSDEPFLCQLWFQGTIEKFNYN